MATNVRSLIAAMRCTSRSCFGVPIPTHTIVAPSCLGSPYRRLELVVGQVAERRRLRTDDGGSRPRVRRSHARGCAEHLGRAAVQVVASIDRSPDARAPPPSGPGRTHARRRRRRVASPTRRAACRREGWPRRRERGGDVRALVGERQRVGVAQVHSAANVSARDCVALPRASGMKSTVAGPTVNVACSGTAGTVLGAAVWATDRLRRSRRRSSAGCRSGSLHFAELGHHQHRAEHDPQIEPQRGVLDVVTIPLGRLADQST